MWQQMLTFLKSWLIFPNLKPEWLLLAVGLAIAFGAVWLLMHWPPLFKRHWLWAAAVVSAFLTLLAVVFVQIPLQTWAGQALMHFWTQAVLVNWLLLAGIPSVLLSGLVQEGAKMLPAVAWWWRRGHQLDPRMGLAIGAIAGAGFGIFEAFWVHGSVFSAGWNWQAVQVHGFQALLPFWERFFTVGAHIAMAALSGYGLAKGLGWQFYLVASGMHAVLNYAVILLQKGIFTTSQVEIYVGLMAVIYTAVIMWLRWWKMEEEPEPEEVPWTKG
jgi:RsiW-degrading membrane proteinase PrsW (M82 family)